jgi:exopolyphosphatase/guanosine-5'-triphosphate,3'-diphosphate pyrophosphatase
MSAVAAIDCGTNSTRLLVAGPDGATLERHMIITRLGAGVDRDRRLDPDAVARTVDVLCGYRKVIDQYGAQRVRMTATSAARDATNREEFFAAAAEVIGVRPELLSGDEEGQLSFAGAVASLQGTGIPGPYLVADIGGGSTELAAGPAPSSGTPRAAAVRSLDVGCVRLTERYLRHDPPGSAELDAARAEVRRQVTAAMGELPELDGAVTLIGLAGTVAALAAIDQRLDHYDRDRVHHYWLERETVERLLAELAAVSAAERRARPGVEEARADVIVGGAVVLAELIAVTGHHRCVTSESDILDGLAQTLRS